MTISGKDWELLHREMDGENAPEASARLRERLAREPELDECYRALLGVGRTLSEVGLVDPPGGIIGDVMRQVRAGRPAFARGTGGLAGWVGRQPGLAVAASLAVGVLAGVLATGTRESGSVERASISATALPSSRLKALPVIDEARLAGSGMRAVAVAHRRGAVVVADIEIESRGPVDLTVMVSGPDLQPSGFESSEGRPAGQVLFDATGLHAQRLPAGGYLLVLRALGPHTGELRLRLESAHGSLEGRLRSGPPSS